MNMKLNHVKNQTEEEKDSIEHGKKCLDERHGIIIDKQRLALAEFRAQLKSKSPVISEYLIFGRVHNSIEIECNSKCRCL